MTTQTAPEGILVTTTSASTQTPPAARPPVTERSADGGSGSGTGSYEPPTPPRPRRLPSPIRPSAFGAEDVFLLVASAFSALCLVWIVFYQLTSLSGGLGFLVAWYFTFLALVWLGTTQLIERQVATDRVVGVVVVSAALLVIGLVLFIVVWVAYKALPSIHWVALFTKDQKNFQVADPNALSQVGILHAIVGTVE